MTMRVHRDTIRTPAEPLSEEVVAGLDEGIRDVVVALREMGWDTCDSDSDAYTMECSLGFAHVTIKLPLDGGTLFDRIAEAGQALKTADGDANIIAARLGMKVRETSLTFPCNPDSPTFILIQFGPE